MADYGTELLETYRVEAVALLTINQQARHVALRLTVAIFMLIAVTVVVGIVARTDDVAIPLPAAVLVLASCLFQQYADLTVIGAVRAALERRVGELIGGHGLIYETVVAPIRKRPPLAAGVRVLQATSALIVAAVLGVGAVVAFDDQPVNVELGFSVLTGVALASAVLSYRDMLRSGPVASRELEAAFERLRT
jgi:hypothetical protein